ncbi:MAG: hypothetical protein LBT76_05935 [Tannerella sp.]|jgi:hypothetical protein|nr:hypothetical protein [Tannerella sp.]
MTQKKKKSPAGKSPDIRKRILNKTFIDKAYLAIRKILRVYGLDPDMFDRLSKHQRQMFMLVETEAPKFKVAEGCRVPRQLVTLVNNYTHHFIRNNCYGNPEIGLTYLELITFGITFYTQVLSLHKADDCNFPPEQMQIVDTIAEKFIAANFYESLTAVGTYIRRAVQMISKVNFRIYGYDWHVPVFVGQGRFLSTVTLYSEESESIYFTYKGQKHKAFRVKAGRIITTPSTGACIDEEDVTFSSREDHKEKKLDIYIQSHALQRIKERVDIFPAHRRNFYVMDTLLYMHRVEFNSQNQGMFECYHDDVLFGYYPYIIRGNKLFVLTFLPIISPETPRGESFVYLLGLQKQDMIYLGMDKLSFFLTVDFTQIPELFQALTHLGLYSLVNYASEDLLPFERDPQKTLRVKRFFENAQPQQM